MLTNSKLFAVFIILYCSNHLFGQDVSNGLVGYWNFDNNYADKISSNQLKVNSSPELNFSKYGEAYTYGQNSSYFYLKNTDSTKKFYSEKGFSWSLWIKCNNITNSETIETYQTILNFGDDVNYEDISLSFGSEFSMQKNLVFKVDGISGAGGQMVKPVEYYPGGGFKNDEWYHIVCIRDYDNDSAHIYLNGIKVASSYFKIPPINRDMVFCIGADYDGAKINIFKSFKGQIDELRIYDKVLSENEIKNIYEIDKISLQIADSLDFGELICSSSIEKTLSLKNLNLNNILFNSSLRNNNFNLISNPIFELSQNQSNDFKVRFNQANDGLYNDILVISNDKFLPQKYVFLNAIKSNIDFKFDKISNNQINYQNLQLNQQKDTSIIIFNKGRKNILLKSINYSKDSLNISSNKQLPYSLSQNDTVIFNISFVPKSGKHSNYFDINLITDCGVSLIKNYLNYSAFDTAFITLKVGNITNAKTGEIVNIPIILQNSSGLENSGFDSIDIVLSCNPSILFPKSNYKTKYLQKERLFIEYKISLFGKKIGDILAELPFRAAFGNSEMDTITIIDNTKNNYLKISEVPGVFAFDNICKEGGIRLFDYANSINITTTFPNPSNGVVSFNYELIENSLTKIMLLNENGQIEKILLNQYMEIGKYSVNYNTSELASANYILYFETQTRIITQKISIIR